jgi:hypothetical protein
MSGPCCHNIEKNRLIKALEKFSIGLQPILAIFGALVILSAIVIWKNPLNMRTSIMKHLLPVTARRAAVDRDIFAHVTSSKILATRLTPEFMQDLLNLEVQVGDSLSKREGLREGGFLSTGRVWLGLSAYGDDIIVWFDYFRDCRCGPAMIDLVRFAFIKGQLVKILERKVRWEEYFLFPPEEHESATEVTWNGSERPGGIGDIIHNL